MSSICNKAEERDSKEDESVARNPGGLSQSDEMDSCGQQETCNLPQILPAQSDVTEAESRSAETTITGTNDAAEDESSHCRDDCPYEGEASRNGSTSSTGSSGSYT
ncbi:unnamed protein product [Dibothriocephalus latus]|uniref:Uncharacterized protein n=1 Tax=Dibothriocephalus latus TaxID=60516 RepID=A0A3P7LYC4_DIBLA|nr:unnamed protein product [Dibothriocephalus latus]